MEIRENENIYIIAPLSRKLDEYEVSRIIKEISEETRNIGLDLTYVRDCSICFIEKLKELCLRRHIGIFNIDSDIFALFNFMKVDKFADLFVSEPDFEDNVRKLINRNFRIV